MTDRDPTHPKQDETHPAPPTAAFGVTDFASIGGTFDAAGLHWVTVIGVLLLLPFGVLWLLAAMVRAAGPLGRLLDYRRYMNGGGW